MLGVVGEEGVDIGRESGFVSEATIDRNDRLSHQRGNVEGSCVAGNKVGRVESRKVSLGQLMLMYRLARFGPQ